MKIRAGFVSNSSSSSFIIHKHAFTSDKARYEFINTRFTDEWYSPESMKERGVENVPLCFLAKSLENMSKCHVAYFCKGWEETRGCRCEHIIAQDYGMTIIYEE